MTLCLLIGGPKKSHFANSVICQTGILCQFDKLQTLELLWLLSFNHKQLILPCRQARSLINGWENIQLNLYDNIYVYSAPTLRAIHIWRWYSHHRKILWNRQVAAVSPSKRATDHEILRDSRIQWLNFDEHKRMNQIFALSNKHPSIFSI